MIVWLLLLPFLGYWLVVFLPPLTLTRAALFAARHGAWRLSRAIGRAAPHLLGQTSGGDIAFHCEGNSLREAGRLAEAVALARARIAEKDVSPWSRNIAIDILISAGAYKAALSAEARDALALDLIQINLSEADYNLGSWDVAEQRLIHLELACWLYPIARAGLLQQRAWIAAHRGRAAEALELCASIKPQWLPPDYRAEYQFTRAAACLGAGRVDEAAASVDEGARVARRLSSKRNALFMRARILAARGDWVGVERSCRDAANHVFRGQGGDGLLLWAQALHQLGQHAEADGALRLVSERDPESDAARTAAKLLLMGSKA
jgi:tetratricopeptide (TPR) repeat protein